jgi:acetyl esterase/lipase
MISDWDDAYANGAHIEAAESYPPRWAQAAGQFRREMAQRQLLESDIAYGEGERERFDLFLPQGESLGLVMFVHGGYWRAFDKSSWSHLAAGPIERGWAVAMPSYDLAPSVSIAGITCQIGSAVGAAAARVDGPIHLSGHSAGGHLVTRMICTDSRLPADVSRRVRRVVSISGLHDLRPLLRTKLNDDLRMSEAEAAAESPALKVPASEARVICWVGADERPEFIRQSELLANIWTGFGIETSVHCAAGKHHFDVIDGLGAPASPLCSALLD